ncbi:hypothetical protein [Hymenobacter sp.]|uniref:hypothetical protein n=1 Tax=Hymenobacter sp. TaxID=1898978 RepID=UPI002EDA0448
MKILRLVLPWLLVSLVLAVLLTGVLLGFDALLQPQFDSQMHNTYFVGQPLFLVGILFLLLLLLVNFFLLLRSRYSLPTYLLLAAFSTLSIGIITCLISPLTAGGIGSWTVYPPLNATETPVASPVNPYQLLLNGAYFLQLLAVATLGYSSYQAGKLATR